MAYKNSFPGMTKFQAQHGGKMLTGLSGIVPVTNRPSIVSLKPDNIKKK